MRRRAPLEPALGDERVNGSHHEGPGDGGRRALARVSLVLGLLLLGTAAAGLAQESAPQPEPEPAAVPPGSATSKPAAPPSPAPKPTGLGFQVIVHADNSMTRLSAKVVASMFLRKAKRWESGDAVVPIDLEPRHEARKVFTRAVHNKSVTAIVGYWQRIIFAGRGTPPESKASEEEVLAFVAGNPGAIGYVSEETRLGNGVKPLTVDDLKVDP